PTVEHEGRGPDRRERGAGVDLGGHGDEGGGRLRAGALALEAAEQLDGGRVVPPGRGQLADDPTPPPAAPGEPDHAVGLLERRPGEAPVEDEALDALRVRRRV